jgi:two-component system, LytTR family, sensor histidine kinase AlgZ
VRKNSRLPNLTNFGIHLRILLIVYSLTIISAILLSNQTQQFFTMLTTLSTIILPIAAVSLTCLFLFNSGLNHLNYWVGVACILAIVIGVTIAYTELYNHYIAFENVSNIAKSCLLSSIATAIVLFYFNLQQRAYSPAIAEARLQALQARIRPHFLFNSINAVLSLIRSQPKRAETALEDMADLFRVLMADNRDLVPLAQEIALSRQYLSIEKLRLEDRLKVNWDIDSMPSDAMIPPLILQPLLENAVYHGIEPLNEGGEINIRIQNSNKELIISISNPYMAEKDKHQGNKMALKNIKERLLLHFDLEANIKTTVTNQQYLVAIHLPNK